MNEKLSFFADELIRICSSEKAILMLIYLIYFGGTLLLVLDLIQKARDSTVHFINDKKTKAKLKKGEPRFDKHIRYLIEANTEKKYLTVFNFKALCILLFISFLALTVRVLFPGVALLFALTIAVMPYLILRVRLESIRSTASHEAELLLNELLIKYRLKNHNMEEAIEEVIKLKRLHKTKPILSKLLIKLRNTRNAQDIRESIRLFSYSIGTNWAKMLGSNIYQSSVSNINVTMSLEDMLIQLREARKLWEEQKRNTAEPRRMLLGIPVIYGLLLYMTLVILEVPLKDYLRNQFVSTQGVTFFTLIVIGFLFSIILVLLLFSRKFDF